MKKKVICKIILALASASLLMTMLGGCGEKKQTEESDPVLISEQISSVASTESPEAENGSEKEAEKQEKLTDDQVLAAIQNYCYAGNPELEDIVNAGETPVYWEVASSSETEIVVLFRSYTGALIRYYVDPTSGETYVTEFVSGVMTEEQKTDETLNVRDYLER
ncbi:MAG: hypothetical protein IKO03_01660 [Lachnospiraceae bacterium]|nr:hypothetical protein [Lachnospiraceae bacterium]MBR3507483.1 hypothetical protein [Lachnospiraceae bacterium]MBR4606294.1 hypothetical protein [Lachnospiraceae bacterium]